MHEWRWLLSAVPLLRLRRRGLSLPPGVMAFACSANVSPQVRDNYNEVYSWSELKDFIHPYIDEGKGFTIQKSSAANSGWTYGRFRIANNICYGNGFSGIHVRWPTGVALARLGGDHWCLGKRKQC